MLEKIFKKSTKVAKVETPKEDITVTGTSVSTEIASEPKVVDLEVAKHQTPLTSEEINDIFRLHAFHLSNRDGQWESFARAIEKAHGIE